ncbi:hypothetical protein MTO96_050504 [Rhipicephalus appendiculatus]
MKECRDAGRGTFLLPYSGAMQKLPLLLPLLLAAAVKEEDSAMQQHVSDAICVFNVGNVSGYVTFHQNRDENVTVQGNITNLPTGEHGFHVHQFGDLSNGCSSTGPPFQSVRKESRCPDS